MENCGSAVINVTGFLRGLPINHDTRPTPHHSRSPGARSVSSPAAGLASYRFNAFKRAAAFGLSKAGPFARNGLFLTRDGLRLHGFRPGVDGPGLLLRSLACRSSYSFRFSAPPPIAG